jgi:two-component system response regulator FixJ
MQPSSSEPTVFVVDDDEAVRDSLGLLLESAGLRVETFGSAPDVLSRSAHLLPACIITDVRMPGMDGLELQQALAARQIRVPVIVITGHGDVPLAVRAMKAGAYDFVEKPFSDEMILASIRTAVRKYRDAVAESATASAFAARLEQLTPREREVLEQLVAGYPNKVIAYNLNISPRTVEIHRARVMDKMQARSLPELVRMALASGIEPSWP